MSRIPHELIREVQISTRAAAGLSDYNPSDPTLPALPSLSAAIAAFDPSPPHLRCKNCNGRLLRGSESIICVYCGSGPHYDVVPDPISFTSTIGYQWLLRSLRLDGSEMVNRTNKSEQDQGQSSPKNLTPLSDFLNFKIPWPAETEKEESSFSDKHSEESKGSLSLTGVAPDKFFIQSKRDVLSDMSTEQPFMDHPFETAGRKDVASPDQPNLFQNFQSPDPPDSSSEHKTSEMFSGWEADFQSADAVNHHGGYESSKNFAGSSDNSGNKIQDSQSINRSTGLEGDLAAEIDSVFGPGKDRNDENPKDNPAVTPAFGDWNSDDMWNNLSSNESRFAGGFDATISSKDAPKDDHALEYSKDLSTGADLFQDFQAQTNYAEMTENKTRNEDQEIRNEDSFEEWNDFFTGSSSLQAPPQNAGIGSDYQVPTSDQKSSEIDLLGLDNKFDEGNLGSFSQPNLSSEMDLLSLDSKFDEGDLGSFSQPNLFSTPTSDTDALTEANAVMPENHASSCDASSPSHESGQDANNGDAAGKSTDDDVKMLISQTHDLSFMLETNLSIPSGSEAPKSPPKD
ncbi:hypothetical protein Salat_2004800 [Sesamum alatum]|uniref:DUF7815 domain-containing protein n=1 Tax=Sesamum alatum TaxID=300844 RepID=A0AAE2CFS8_9LAMI|nr:hypothetical protein Salat_2004800 [Sesamum alatum]